MKGHQKNAFICYTFWVFECDKFLFSFFFFSSPCCVIFIVVVVYNMSLSWELHERSNERTNDQKYMCGNWRRYRHHRVWNLLLITWYHIRIHKWIVLNGESTTMLMNEHMQESSRWGDYLLECYGLNRIVFFTLHSLFLLCYIFRFSPFVCVCMYTRAI